MCKVKLYRVVDRIGTGWLRILEVADRRRWRDITNWRRELTESWRVWIFKFFPCVGEAVLFGRSVLPRCNEVGLGRLVLWI